MLHCTIWLCDAQLVRGQVAAGLRGTANHLLCITVAPCFSTDLHAQKGPALGRAS